MSETWEARSEPTVGVPRQGTPDLEPEQTGWVGWILFAGVMMVLVGTFQAIAGLAALFDDEYFLVRKSDLLVSVSYTGWGWVHLIAGTLILLAGFGLMAGQMWARIMGVLLAGLSAILNIAFLAAYPLWSLTMIAMDVLVIYAICVHGREMKSAYRGSA